MLLSFHRKLFDRLGIDLGYHSFDDWYNTTVEAICKHGGSGILKHFGNSPSTALQSVYPEHLWRIWKFKQVPKGYWDKKYIQRQFFDWPGEELGYHSMDDWYKVTRKDIDVNGGTWLLDKSY